MGHTNEVAPEVKKPVKEKVEYDGYYRIDVKSANGHLTKIYCRGYKLKSWLNFEKGLSYNIECKHQQVSEQEYMDNHWTKEPLGVEDVVVQIESSGTGNKVPVPEQLVKRGRGRPRKEVKTNSLREFLV